jgi:hypothetical protein
MGFLFLAGLPATVWAQGGSISGLVTDNTAGVLPGVTVEAASPVMIAGSVTAVTDGSGRYTVANLRPGTYTVTFLLQGFNKLIRDGVVLATRRTGKRPGQGSRAIDHRHWRLAAGRHAACASSSW